MPIPFANPDDFVAAVAPPEPSDVEAWFFIVQGAQVLVRVEGDAATLPLCNEINALAVEPVRAQFLGRLAGRPIYSWEVRPDAIIPSELQWQGLRSLYGRLDDALFALAGRAVQIVDWDRAHQFCGRCATATIARINERVRDCPACAQVAYPRIAPAVMALVKRDRKLLLARSPHFPSGMYSALAGFVEPGEALEECLLREVQEEVGVAVKNLRYFASQPWPFPHSLMIAFICDYAGGELMPDRTEIEDCGWFSLEALPQLPGKISIARRLIDHAIAELRETA